MYLTYYLIRLLMHYDSPYNKDFVDEDQAQIYLEKEIIELNDGMGGNKYRLTELGKVWLISRIKETPMPVKTITYQ